MDKNSDYQLLIMQANIEANRKDCDEETKNLTEDLTEIITSMMNNIKILKFSPENKVSPKAQDTNTVFTDNKRDTPLEGGNSTKIGGMWNLKNDISSPKFYELLIKTELKEDNALDIKSFYNHIKRCINTFTRLREEILSDYHYIKIHSESEE